MPASDILTRAEIDQIRFSRPEPCQAIEMLAATIEQMAGLLEEECQIECEDGMTCEGPHSDNGSEFCCIPCGKKRDLLRCYHATTSDTSGKEGE